MALSFVVGNCPVHCRIFSSIPGLYPLYVSSTHPLFIVTTKIDPDFAKCSLWSKISPHPIDNHYYF